MFALKVAIFSSLLYHFLINKGLEINGIEYKFRLLYLIADSPAKYVMLNTMRFNGEYGCTHCLNPGFQLYRGKRVYLFSYTFIVRTNEMYKTQVDMAIYTNVIEKG